MHGFGKEKNSLSLTLFIESIVCDVRVGLRTIVSKPGFTLLIVLSLGIGIGANTAIFSVIDGILLRPAAIPRAQDLITVDTAASHATRFGDSSYLDYLDYARQTRALSGVLAYRRAVIGMEAYPGAPGARSQVIWGLLVTGNYFSLLEVAPSLGRDFLPDEDLALGKAPVAIISHNLWQTTFNGDPHIVGANIKLNGQLFSIVGVAPRFFSALDLSYRPDIYVPMAMAGAIIPGPGVQLLQTRSSRSFVIRGLLRVGATIAQAQAEADVICSSLTQQFPATNKDTHFIVRRDLDYRLDNNGVVLSAVLIALVLFVLLIACANAASLLIARATHRAAITATQIALGASRTRLFRQFITESAVMTALGSAFGLILAWLGIRLAGRLIPYQPSPQGPLFRIDARVLACALLTSTLTVVLCGLAPAFLATREAARAAMRLRSASSLGFAAAARRMLVCGQVALSVVLLIGASLFLKSFVRLQSYDLGFNPAKVFVVTMNPSFYNYSPSTTAEFYQELLRRSKELRGVRSASLAAIPPFLGLYSQDISIDGYLAPTGDKIVDTLTNRISPTYFETLEIPLLLGRQFTENDRQGTPKVAIVNESFVRRFIVGKEQLSAAIGHVLRRRDNLPIQIVGIVKDSVYGANTPLGSPPAPVFYTPFLQGNDSYAAIQVRCQGPVEDLGAVLQQLIHNLDPAIAPIYSVSLAAIVEQRALFIPRITAVLSGLFGVIALLLALIGLYGVVSYTVACRTQEIGVRMALGAQQSSIFRLVLASSMSIVVTGIAVGITVALLLSKYAAGLAAGASVHDPITFVGLPLTMLVATLAASLVPARSATRVEPVAALRNE